MEGGQAMKRWAFRWVGCGYFHDRETGAVADEVDVFVPVELDAEMEQEHSSESESEKP